MNLQLYKETLKKHRVSDTTSRLELFLILDNIHDPITMKHLVEIASPKLDRSTVYRTLDLFEKIGIATRVYNGWKYRIELSEAFSSHHHHMTCTKCQTIISFHESNVFEKELQKIASDHDFLAKSHSLEIKGLCKKCAQ